MPLSEVERQHCAETALGPHRPLSVARLFSEPARSDSALAIHALLESLQSIPESVSDPSVATAKLAWWEQQFSMAREGPAQHPVVHALQTTGAWRRLDPAMLSALLAVLARQLDPEPNADLAALEQSQAMAGRMVLALEARALEQPELDARAAAALGAGLRVARLAWRLVPDARAGRLWLPLDVQAQSGIAHSEIATQRESDAARAAVRQVIELALDALQRGREALGDAARAHPVLMLRVRVTEHQLGRAFKHPATALAGEHPGMGVREVLGAWREARRLNRGPA